MKLYRRKVKRKEFIFISILNLIFTILSGIAAITAILAFKEVRNTCNPRK